MIIISILSFLFWGGRGNKMKNATPHGWAFSTNYSTTKSLFVEQLY
jgi:hypothetical protein